MNDRSTAMKVGDRTSDLVHMGGLKPARDRHLIEQAALIETDHLNHGVNELASAIESEAAIVAATDGANAQIKARRSPGVQFKLLLTRRQS
jgi:hypothetical protein